MDKLIIDQSETSHLAKNQPDLIIPVIREEVVVGKKIVEKGKILIEKSIKSEEISVEVPLMSEELQIQHVTVNQYIEASPEIRYEGDTIIIPVIKEVMVKKLLLVEELRITIHVHNVNKAENFILRKEEVKIKRKE